MMEHVERALVECVYCIGRVLEDNPEVLKVIEEDLSSTSPGTDFSYNLSVLGSYLKENMVK